MGQRDALVARDERYRTTPCSMRATLGAHVFLAVGRFTRASPAVQLAGENRERPIPPIPFERAAMLAYRNGAARS